MNENHLKIRENQWKSVNINLNRLEVTSKSIKIHKNQWESMKINPTVGGGQRRRPEA